MKKDKQREREREREEEEEPRLYKEKREQKGQAACTETVYLQVDKSMGSQDR